VLFHVSKQWVRCIRCGFEEPWDEDTPLYRSRHRPALTPAVLIKRGLKLADALAPRISTFPKDQT
jgi:hypothetical protein